MGDTYTSPTFVVSALPLDLNLYEFCFEMYQVV